VADRREAKKILRHIVKPEDGRGVGGICPQPGRDRGGMSGVLRGESIRIGRRFAGRLGHGHT